MTDAAPTEPIRHAPIALWRIARHFICVLHGLFGAPGEVAAQHTLRHEAYALLVSWVRCAEAMLRHLLLIEAQGYPKPNTRPLLHTKRQGARKPVLFCPDRPQEWRVSFRCFVSPTLRQPRIKSGGDAGGDAEGNAAGSVSVSLTPDLIRGKAKRPDAEPVFVFREDRVPRAKTQSSPRRAGACAKGATRKRLLRQDRLWLQYEPKQCFHSTWPIALRYEALLRVFNDPTAYARRLARRLHATPHRAVELLRAPPQAEARIDRYDDFRERAKTASAGFGFRVDTS